MRPKDEPLGVVVYVMVDDIEALVKKVTELGGKLVAPKMPLGAGHGALFEEPGGNMLGLYEERS